MQLELDKLKKSEESRDIFESIILTIENFTLKLVAGSSTVVAGRNAQNVAADEVPPVLPLELCGIALREFAASLQQQKQSQQMKKLKRLISTLVIFKSPFMNKMDCKRAWRMRNLTQKVSCFKTVGVLLEATFMICASIVVALQV